MISTTSVRPPTLLRSKISPEPGSGDLEVHRWNPDLHLRNMNLVQYERAYAPREDRQAARLRHLARWPDCVEMAVGALDRVSVPMAEGLLSSARGSTPRWIGSVHPPRFLGEPMRP